MKITINGREYTVEARPNSRTEGPEAGMNDYRLTGPRGADYFTVRYARSPEFMFCLNAKGSIVRNFELTDKNGKLEEA